MTNNSFLSLLVSAYKRYIANNGRTFGARCEELREQFPDMGSATIRKLAANNLMRELVGNYDLDPDTCESLCEASKGIPECDLLSAVMGLEEIVTRTAYNHLGGRPLQSFYQIVISTVEGSKRVTFHSKIHVKKANMLPMWWSSELSDWYILNDNALISKINALYGEVTA